MKPIYKAFALKGAALEENRICGAASVMGNLDRGGWYCRDVVAPGAFKDALADFLKHGFVADTHEWTMKDLHAMPLIAEEKGNELYTEAEFHSDPESQAIRTKCIERMEKGLSVGLSIGFSIGERMMFPSGSALWEWAEKQGSWAMGSWDRAEIENYDGECRLITKIARLFEYSITPVPMNPKALASDAKRFAWEDGLLTGLTFDEHSDQVLIAVRSLATRATEYASARTRQGRSLNPDRAAEFEALGKALLDLVETKEAEPDDLTAAFRELSMRTGAARMAAFAAGR